MTGMVAPANPVQAAPGGARLSQQGRPNHDGIHTVGRPDPNASDQRVRMSEIATRPVESGGVRLVRAVARPGQRGSDNARTHGIPWVLRWAFGLDLLTKKPRFSPRLLFG